MTMMTKISIDILRVHVVRAMALSSAYVAAKRQDADCWADIIPIIREDDELLAIYWHSSCARLYAFLCQHLKRLDGRQPDIGYDCLRLHVGIMVNSCLCDSLHQQLTSAMTAFLQNDMMAQWMAVVLPEREPRCREEADALLSAMAETFAIHRLPLRVRKRMEVI